MMLRRRLPILLFLPAVLAEIMWVCSYWRFEFAGAKGWHASWRRMMTRCFREGPVRRWRHIAWSGPSWFQALPQDHLSLAKHLTAETKVEEFVPGKGMVVRWERLRRQNHWFDALYNACATGHGVGVRLVEEVKQAPPPPPQRDDLVSEGWMDRFRFKEYPR
jgi:hypothetical protein